jgi:glycosyltransferase involved in cell wall biosynthesis
METIDICIPTLRPLEEIRPQIEAIEQNTPEPHRIIASCQNASAAINRNFCLQYARSQIIVMVDDDICGFFPSWLSWLTLPLACLSAAVMVSARLMTPDGRIGAFCGGPHNTENRWAWVPPKRDCVMPTAAVAFRNWHLRFDEHFIGAGFEDSDFCFQYLDKDPKAEFYIANECKMVHRNEMKGQMEDRSLDYAEQPNVRKNREYFWWKWNVP